MVDSQRQLDRQTLTLAYSGVDISQILGETKTLRWGKR